ncbi:MAG: co-chaperone DjlA [Gammaproteobacteria bacterium]|nr:MAG: co-chaperone DjlA [Gammaproteobacteria bacterium]
MQLVWLGPAVGVLVGYGLAGGGALGLLGAVAGGLLGRQFDIIVQLSNGLYQMGHRQSSKRGGDIQAAFFECTFLCLGRIAKCDGPIKPEEIQWTERVMDRMALSPQQKQNAIRLFDRGKDLKIDISKELQNLHDKCGRRITLLQMFMEILVQGALADGDMHQREWAVLTHIAGSIRFRVKRLEAIVRSSQAFQEFKSQHSETGTEDDPQKDLLRAYQVLAIEPTVTDEELKKAYRRLMNQHHPDKLVSKGLPESMVEMAKERTQAIRAAYEEIRNYRAEIADAG